MADINPPRGMRDILPEDYFLRDELISYIRGVYERYGYAPIDTPSPERIEYLSAKAGGETEQLMFKILARGQAGDAATAPTNQCDMGLRYDLTVPFCRFYASNQATLPAVFRRYQIGPVWRADRPQRGRLREFYQCDVDVVGIEGTLAECEVMLATSEALRGLSLDHFVKISDRRLLPAIFKGMALSEGAIRQTLVSIDKLDKIGVDGVRNEIAAAVTEDEFKRLYEFIPKIAGIGRTTDPAIEVLGDIPESSKAEVEAILLGLRTIKETVQRASASPVEINFWPSLVRGMSYYTGPIFEIWNGADPFSLAGGGRYDTLVGQFLGRNVPACGFSIGFERILTVLKDRASKAAPRKTKAAALIAIRHQGLDAAALTVAGALRAASIPVEVFPYSSDMKKQFKHAEMQGIRFIVSVADASGTVELIDCSDRSRIKGEVNAVIEKIAAHLKN
jgi:histidyl-tRNA synthetase